MPAQPVTAATCDPLGLQHRSLLDVQLEVGADALAARDGVAAPARGRRRSPPAPRRPAAPRRRSRAASSPGSRRPGDRRAAEEAAAEARALLVGEVDERERPRRRRAALRPGPQHPDRRHHPEGAVEPAAVGHRVEVRAEHQGRLRARPRGSPRGCPPRRTRRLEPDLSEQLAEEGARLAATPRPSRAAGRRSRAAGAPVELAQVGDHPVGVDRRATLSTSARSASRARSRRSAWPRQWAPPPPSVNISRSGVEDLDAVGAQRLVEPRRRAGRRAPGRRRARRR